MGYTNDNGKCMCLLEDECILENDRGWRAWEYDCSGAAAPYHCSAYMAYTGCSWTAQEYCPGQEQGANASKASDDGSEGYECCCKREFWRWKAALGESLLNDSVDITTSSAEWIVA